MKKSKWIMDVIITVVFALSTIGLEYANALTSEWILWLLTAFMALCLYGSAQTGLVSGLVIAFCGPVAGLIMDVYTLSFAIVLAVANIALVVIYWAFKQRQFWGVLIGAVIRYALIYGVVELLIPKLDVTGELYASVASYLDWEYLFMTLAAGLVFWLVTWLMRKTKKAEPPAKTPGDASNANA